MPIIVPDSPGPGGGSVDLTPIVTAIGAPAVASDTVPVLSEHINTSKATLATNLTAKGVPASASDPLAVLADLSGKIPLGGAFDRIEILGVTESGTVVFPVGTKLIDFALVPGASTPTSYGPHYGEGAGKQIVRRYGISVIGMVSQDIAIAAAMGNTTFMGVTAIGVTGQTPSTSGISTAVPLWGTWGRWVGGHAGAVTTENAGIPPVDLLAGAAYRMASNATYPVYLASTPNTGGGGIRWASTSVYIGSSGYAEIICYIKD